MDPLCLRKILNPTTKVPLHTDRTPAPAPSQLFLLAFKIWIMLIETFNRSSKNWRPLLRRITPQLTKVLPASTVSATLLFNALLKNSNKSLCRLSRRNFRACFRNFSCSTSSSETYHGSYASCRKCGTFPAKGSSPSCLCSIQCSSGSMASYVYSKGSLSSN